MRTPFARGGNALNEKRKGMTVGTGAIPAVLMVTYVQYCIAQYKKIISFLRSCGREIREGNYQEGGERVDSRILKNSHGNSAGAREIR